MSTPPENPFPTLSDFGYLDAFRAANLPPPKNPPSPRFSVILKNTGETLVVIEAPDALIASERFMRVRHIIRRSVADRGIISITERDIDEPCHCSFFAHGFFEILDRADNLNTDT